jgi:hypothetical protein
MQLTIKKQIGKHSYTFIVEGKNLNELVTESGKLSFSDVYKCGICEDTNIFLGTHEAARGKQKFQYTTIRCGKCKASINFGQRTDNPDCFYLRTKEVVKNGKTVKELDWREVGKESEE